MGPTGQARLILDTASRPPGREGLRPRGSFAAALGLAAAASVLLLVLAGLLPGGDALRRALGQPLGFFLAVLSACLAPGYALARLTSPRDGRDRADTVGNAFGLGLAWLVLPSAALLSLGLPVATAQKWLAAATVGLVGFYAAHQARAPRGPRLERPRSGEAMTSAWLVAAAAFLGYRLFQVALQRPRFTQAGDEWILMRSIRYFLEADPVARSWDHDAWDYMLAGLLNLSGTDLFAGYRVLLPVVLIPAAGAALLVLAGVLFDSRRIAWLAVGIQSLYCLSDMQPRGEGMGMALLVRIMEDKYVALLVLLPLAQAAFLRLLRDPDHRSLLRFVLLAAAAVLVYPVAVVWLALTAGATLLVGMLRGERPLPAWALAVVVVSTGLVAAAAWWQRSSRPAEYFRLFAPEWPMNGPLRALSRGQLHVLSWERGWYLASLDLLSHPLMIAAVLVALALLPRARALGPRFLAVSTFVPLLVVYNPLTAVLLGHLISPWMVYRVLWIVPVALVLAEGLDRALVAAQRALTTQAPGRGAYGLLWVGLLAAMAAALHPRTLDSRRALKQRNAVQVTPEERGLMEAVARLSPTTGRVLAPLVLSIHLPAWTSRLTPYPGLDILRVDGPARRAEDVDFYTAAELGPAQRALLARVDARYVITRTGTPLDEALRKDRQGFQSLYGNARFSLYAWHPE